MMKAAVVTDTAYRQLKPTNTSAKGKIQFNALSDRLDIPLPCRLAEEGFPIYRLLEQRRMHASIAKFPNDKIYDGMLRNGPEMYRPLESVRPGMREALINILAKSAKRPPSPSVFLSMSTLSSAKSSGSFMHISRAQTSKWQTMS